MLTRIPLPRLLGSSLWLAALLAPAIVAPCPAQQYRVEARRMPLLPPGTVIGDRGNDTWRLIIKSHPKCTHGDLDKVPSTHVKMSSLLSTSLMAEVKRTSGANPRYILNRVAGGVSKRINGRDVVITPDTQAKLGAGLGFLEKMLLKEFVKEQSTVTFVGRSENFAVFDTPIVLRVDNSNQLKVLRYAVVVDSGSGELNTFCWPIHLNDGRYVGVAGPMQWLPPNHVIQCKLWVDASEIRFGIPTKEAFGCLSVPPGQVEINLPPQVADVLCAERFTVDSIKQAEAVLRRAIPQAQAALQRNAAAR